MPLNMERVIGGWRDKLLDLTKRNRLISCRIGKRGAVGIEHPRFDDLLSILIDDSEDLIFVKRSTLLGRRDDPDSEDAGGLLTEARSQEDEPREVRAESEFNACLNSPRLAENAALTRLSDKEVTARLYRLYLTARTAQQEQGVNPLYLAMGFLRWFESDDDEEGVLSPLLLAPVCLNREHVDAPWQLRLLEDDVVANFALAQLLKTDFRIAFPPLDDSPDAEACIDYLSEVESQCSRHLRWKVAKDCALGLFSFQKMAMWEDLGKNGESIGKHPLCRAIAGDGKSDALGPVELPESSSFDEEIHPKDAFHILDCDSSQLEAIVAARLGCNLIIDGPPGTGKSQTIANLVAEFMADGKTVLFVSEKVAALEVVKRRLDACGLGDFCLELHSHKANKKTVVAELGRCITLPDSDSDGHDRILNDLFQVRRRLNRYCQALHEPRQPMGISLFDAVGKHSALQTALQLSSDIPEVLAYTEDRLITAVEIMGELARLGDTARNFSTHPWRGVSVEESSLSLERSISEKLPQLVHMLEQRKAAISRVAELGFGQQPLTFEQLDAIKANARDSLKAPEVSPDWFRGSVADLATNLVRLDSRVRRFKIAAGNLSQFDLGSALGSDLGDLAHRVEESLELDSRLRAHNHTGVRALFSHLSSTVGNLDTATECQTRFESVRHELYESLGIEDCDSIDEASRAAKLTLALARIGQAPSTWLSPNGRMSFRTAIAEAQLLTARAQEIQSDLKARLVDGAFDPSLTETLREVIQYDAWWVRLSLRWRRLRKGFQRHYCSGARPSPKTLLADARSLIEFRECQLKLQEIIAKDRQNLVTRDDGSVDLQATLETIEALDKHLDAWGRPIPQGLNDLLLDWDKGRADVIAEDAALLEARLGDLVVAIESAAGNVRHFGGRGKRWERMPCPELSAWIGEAHRELARWRDTLQTITEMLVEGQDAEWSGISKKIADLKNLRELKKKIGASYQAVEHAIPGVAKPEEHHWQRAVAMAKELQSLAAEHDGQIPQHMIKLCCDPVSRKEVVELVAQDDAVCDPAFSELCSFLGSLFPLDRSVSRGIVVNTASLDDLLGWLTYLVDHLPELRDWLDLRTVRRRLSRRGLTPIFEMVSAGGIPDDELSNAFVRRFWELWLDLTFDSDASLKAFRSVSHDEVVRQFCDLDLQAIKAAAKRIRGRLLDNKSRPDAHAFSGPLHREIAILRHEMEKQRRHLPLRQLFSKIPRTLLGLKPCVMMSPLSVSTYFDSEQIQFDVVIFDEASQVRPHDSVGAVYRGDQMIVAGDQCQLPPTSFFEHADQESEDDEDDEDYLSTADLESILDVCQSVGFPRRRLKWHYRSRREPLIAFSNRHIYSDELITFPSVLDAGDDPAIEFDFVSNGRFRGGSSGGYNPIEAKRVADMVMRELLRNPSASVGVVTFGIGQRDAVQDAIDQIRHGNRGLDPLFREDRDEPFFVKNLENVQGDERDIMIFSIGYAPDENGRFAMRFGPLNQNGGERRLNVAVTRARTRVIVVSSIRGESIDLSRTSAQGVKLLRAYLEYAERGPSALGTEVREDSERDYESEFERQVGLALEREGFLVRRQVGCGGFRLDLALASPDQPGRYVLGVECDGATYHRHATARDRDRLRQYVLEELGWTICRIWSTSWYRDPKREIEKVTAAFKSALRDIERRRACRTQPVETSDPIPHTADSQPIAQVAITESPRSAPDSQPQSVLNLPSLGSELEIIRDWMTSLGARAWSEVANWGRRSRSLEYGEQRLLLDIASYLYKHEAIPEQQIRATHELYHKATLLGYREKQQES